MDEKKDEKTASCLLKKGMSLQFIAEVTGLTEDEIKALDKNPEIDAHQRPNGALSG